MKQDIYIQTIEPLFMCCDIEPVAFELECGLLGLMYQLHQIMKSDLTNPIWMCLNVSQFSFCLFSFVRLVFKSFALTWNVFSLQILYGHLPKLPIWCHNCVHCEIVWWSNWKVNFKVGIVSRIKNKYKLKLVPLKKNSIF